MGARDRAATAFDQGAATGRALLGLGLNNDLAPVADVPVSTSSFMYQQGRTWSFSASVTTALASAFAAGLDSSGVVATMKHFPGLGDAVSNTDTQVVTITASKSTLAPGLMPYAAAIKAALPLIMLANATYTAYDPKNAAGWSHAIAVSLLRDQLGFTGVTITDSLSGTAGARHVSVNTLAVRAAAAGTDMILISGSEASSRATYAALLAAARAGTISLATLETSYTRILALKTGL
jgi:beta-N-acetylhexosaminidase